LSGGVAYWKPPLLFSRACADDGVVEYPNCCVLYCTLLCGAYATPGVVEGAAEVYEYDGALPGL
jgi:hypothetical protein